MILKLNISIGCILFDQNNYLFERGFDFLLAHVAPTFKSKFDLVGWTVQIRHGNSGWLFSEVKLVAYALNEMAQGHPRL